MDGWMDTAENTACLVKVRIRCMHNLTLTVMSTGSTMFIIIAQFVELAPNLQQILGKFQNLSSS